MRSILVVSSDAEQTERIKAALGAEGVWISEVEGRTHAMRVVADQAPDLVVVDSEVEGAPDLLRSFGSAAGGPGVVLLRRATGGSEPVGEAGADAVLDEPIAEGRLAREVRRLLTTPRSPAVSASGEDDRRLTAEEIFGDILREVESVEPDQWPTTLDPEPAPTRLGAASRADPEPRADAEPATPEPAAAPAVESAQATDDPPTPALMSPTDIVAPEDASPPPEVPNRFGHYELGERIAVGGMAEIWEARMTGVEGFEKRVAIKKILPHLSDGGDFERMFVEEAKLAAGLNHENIIHIYDLGKINDQFFIAMEYVEGHDLGAILAAAKRRGEPIPTGLAALVGVRLASALDYAHRRPDSEGEADAVVHRDVSPRNVLVGTDGRIKLCDFGVAKVASSVAQTQFGAIKGKIPYMSPEQAYGRSVDGRSDLFSLGVVLYEMATGRRLFAADSEISLLESVRECRVRDPREVEPTIPDSFAEVILRALRAEPDDRFATVGEMQRELEEILYSLRPTPGADDLARYLEEIFSEPVETSSPATPSTDPLAEVEPEPPLEGVLMPPPPGAQTPKVEIPLEAVAASGEQRPKRRLVVWGLVVLLLLTIAALAAYWYSRPASPPPVRSASPVVLEPVAPPPLVAGAAEEPPAESEPASGAAVPTPSPADSSATIEDLVSRELAQKEAELRRIFQEQEAELRRELEELGQQPVVPEEPPAADSGDDGERPPS